jgi:hypothetical protein
MTEYPAIRCVFVAKGYDRWCTVEQNRDTTRSTLAVIAAHSNCDYLASIGFN